MKEINFANPLKILIMIISQLLCKISKGRGKKIYIIQKFFIFSKNFLPYALLVKIRII